MQCKRIMAKTERGTELTTVVLDRDVIGQELVLTSHTNEQRTSSPVETRMEEWREEETGRGRESVGEVGDRRGLGFVDTQHCQIHAVSHGAFVKVNVEAT